MKKFLIGMLLVLCLLCTAALADGDAPALLKDLGKSWDGWTIPFVTNGYEGEYACFIDKNADYSSEPTAMAVLTRNGVNRLCLLQKNEKGKWDIVINNKAALRQTAEYPRIEAGWWVSYLAEEGIDMTLSFGEDDEGVWRIDTIEMWNGQYEYGLIDIYRQRIVYNKLDGSGKPVTVEGVYENAMQEFILSNFPMTAKKARKDLTMPPYIPMDSSDIYRIKTPRVIKFDIGERHAVYSAPSNSSFRAANGRATLSTNDWVQVFGKEDGWLMVQYDISSSQMRIGYIHQSALPSGAWVRDLDFAYLPYRVVNNTYLTDDPIESTMQVMTLTAGTEVTYLGSMGNWGYIETQTETGEFIRGFVPSRFYNLEEIIEEEEEVPAETGDGTVG